MRETGAMTHVVFYRNLNLGHRNSPTKDQLVAALIEAGAESARSFQTNGTVIVEARDATQVVADAAPLLERSAGFTEPGLVRALDIVERAVTHAEFAAHRDDRTYRETVTVFDGGGPLPWALPWTNDKDDLDLLHVVDGIALGIIRQRGTGVGNPTGVIEKATGAVATTRTLGTVQRLLRAADR